MEELYVIGTGNAMVTRCYNTCYVLRKGEEFFLVDCGGGNTIMKKLEDMQIPLAHIHHIFITHEHCDHTVGFIWLFRLLASKMKTGKLTEPVFVYAHEELLPSLEIMCRMTIQKKLCDLIGKQIFLIPLKNGDQKEILGQTVTFFDIESTKAKQFGFTTTLSNGRKLSFTGDEPYHDCNYAYVKDSDWLFHEAFCLYEDREQFKPYEKHHSTVKDACELAERMHISNLVLWHTEDTTDISTRKERYLAEGKPYFSGNLFVPDDGERIPLV
ncbi:MAG: MBL fold metallo-hydrolase [Lachnospiraceae bacterium]|nr:MBL fold metallo-hydrolase [Lachnospiraceae bacterium]